MLFNSFTFLFAFLPSVLAVFVLLRLRSVQFALGWLILSSLIFYAWWNPQNLFVIVPTIVFNFGIATAISNRVNAAANRRPAGWLLAVGIIVNVGVLGYFKYANFARTIMNDLAGTEFVLQAIILPLGISFITFQLIAFLVDVHGGRIPTFSFRDFCLFILFFPQLIAGPIVHYREMMPQFQSLDRHIDREGLAVGLTLLGIGLFKKVVLADGIAMHVSPIYSQAAVGYDITLVWAWIAALGFTLQIYFDFSAYSDMAAGLALAIGVRLPVNFFSPLKATNIIDFWARWHITLTRFLTAYVYNPITLWLNRRRLSRGKPLLNHRRPEIIPFFYLLAVPTLLTMLISGIWHGAAYLFVAWGVLHGIYLTVNHAWRMFGLPDSVVQQLPPSLWQGLSFGTTFLAVVIAMVLFRGPTPAAANEILQGLIGLNGLALPEGILDRLGPAAGALIGVDANSRTKELLVAIAWVVSLLFIALGLPNSLQVLAPYKPVVEDIETPGSNGLISGRLGSWRPGPVWALIISLMVFLAVYNLGGPSEFLYWQF